MKLYLFRFLVWLGDFGLLTCLAIANPWVAVAAAIIWIIVVSKYVQAMWGQNIDPLGDWTMLWALYIGVMVTGVGLIYFFGLIYFLFPR